MIHLLMCIAGYYGINIELPKSAATHLLYADGTFKNMLNYPENCNNWANYLQLKDVNGKLYKMFLKVSTKRINILIHELEDIFNKFAELKIGKIRGDKVSIEVLKTNSDDYYSNIDKTIEYLSKSLNWAYNKNNWKVLSNRQHKYYTFKKEISSGLNLKIYNEIISKNPLSMAVTARSRVEYTICT